MTLLDLFTQGLFDYAGMFPPASLGFEDALEKAAGFHRTLQRPGLVGGNLVVGWEALEKLSPEKVRAARYPEQETFRVCVLGLPLLSENPDSLNAASRTADAHARGRRKWPKIKINSFEVKLPAAAPLDNATVEVLRLAETLGGAEIPLFIEPEWPAERWRSDAAALFDWLKSLRQKTGEGSLGLKFRGSGPTAVTPEALAEILPRAVTSSMRLKATAGLHHPIVEAGRYGNALGFLSLVLCLRALQRLGPNALAPEAMVRLLKADDPKQLHLDETPGPDPEKVALFARAVPFSIGSCSLDEPDQDLARLFP